MQIKGLLFDKDGTLFDFQATWSVWARKILEQEADGDDRLLSDLAKALGFDLSANKFEADSFVIAGTVDEIADAMLAILLSADKSSLIQRLNLAAAEVPQIEAAPLQQLFALLKNDGYILGIATNDAESPARAHLASAGISELFDFIVGYDSGYGGKPEPGQMFGFCDVTGLNPNQCVMVGDSTHDLEAGRAAGMKTVGVLTGPAAESDLAALADSVLPTIAELPKWLSNLE